MVKTIDADAGDISERKKEIRMAILRQRAQLAPVEIRQAASAITLPMTDLLRSCFACKEGELLMSAAYAAIRSELSLAETWPLLLGHPGRLYFPAVVDDHLELGAVPEGRKPQDWLQPGCMGIPEPPQESRRTRPPPLDLILVPGLAFDRKGNRIGWGKAYYDGLLARLPASTLRVGIAYDFQIMEELPADEHDQPLDALMTPSDWFYCSNRSRP
ncbi:MAG: 5-formyltetrahydrofolate cyclo-ligase [Ruminococcaceae bacterium]|nr:5-formyltetrahydrofolate cyclo-ligase [Oscillospiraceae bacterium]